MCVRQMTAYDPEIWVATAMVQISKFHITQNKSLTILNTPYDNSILTLPAIAYIPTILDGVADSLQNAFHTEHQTLSS